MPVKFLADANLDQDIVARVLLREPKIEFLLPESLIPQGTPDPEVLAIAASIEAILVTHDRATMPAHLALFVSTRDSAGVIIIPKYFPIAAAIEDLILIWHGSIPSEWVNCIRWLPL